jgi:hypothetical protein
MSNEEDKSLTDFVSKALRGPKAGAYQQLLSQKLVKSIQTGEALPKITSICEAAMISRNKEKLDMAHIERVYKVTQSLTNAQSNKENEAVIIPWSFPETEENYKEYIAAWNRIKGSYYPLLARYGRRNSRLEPSFSHSYTESDRRESYYATESERKRINDEISHLSEWEGFFEKTSAFSKESFYSLRAEFEGWALPTMMKILTKITEEIDPEVYRDTLGLMTVGEPQDKKQE